MLLLMQAAASIGCLRLLRYTFGERLGILPPLALYLFSVITLPAFIWWAAGINQLPASDRRSSTACTATSRTCDQAASSALATHGLDAVRARLLREDPPAVRDLSQSSPSPTSRPGDCRPIGFETLEQLPQGGADLLGVWRSRYLALSVATALNFDPDGANDHPAPVAIQARRDAFIHGARQGPVEVGLPQRVFAIADPTDALDPCVVVVIDRTSVHISSTQPQSGPGSIWLRPGLPTSCWLLQVGRAFVGPVIALEYRYQTEVACHSSPSRSALAPCRSSVRRRRPSPQAESVPRQSATECWLRRLPLHCLDVFELRSSRITGATRQARGVLRRTSSHDLNKAADVVPMGRSAPFPTT